MKPTGGSEASGWQVGSTVSGRREREGDTGSVFYLGCGLVSCLGRKGCLGPIPFLFCFLLFLFCFLISLITFANLVQIASNQLCKVSKIQDNNTEQ
jgi:hypothetical protein